jgi:pyruvate dehydrogenase E2 component (dihydrolipoamide acetyltransferase)
VATAITMPRLGLTMQEGTVVEWRVGPGDAVHAGDTILVVESEKAAVDVSAFVSGVVATIYADAGTTVPVGALLGAIATPDEAFDAEAFAAAFVPAGEVPAAASVERDAGVAGTAAPAAASSEPALKAAPAARALARRLGLELACIHPTGPGGRIVVEDVERVNATRVSVNGTALAVETVGAGPPILLITGYGVDRRSWRRQVDGLAGAATVTSYDHRGIGDSARIGPGPVTIADLAADAAALLARGEHGPATVVGASLGAAVALELARQRPELIRGLVLITPVVLRDPRLEAVLRALGAYERSDDEARIRTMLAWMLGREHLAHAGKREAAAAALRAMAAATPIATLRLHGAALLDWLGAESANLDGITVPTLIVAGDDDILTPRAQTDAATRALSGARLVVLPGAGHAIAIERPAELCALVLEFAYETSEACHETNHL